MKLFNKLSILTLILGLVVSLTRVTPVMAVGIGGINETQINAGDPQHPVGAYLLGMLIHFRLQISNPNASIPMTVNIFDIEPGGSPTIQVGSNVVIPAGQAWNYNPFYDYTIVAGDLEPAVGPYGPTHKVVNKLSANGIAGDGSRVTVDLTSRGLVASPSLAITKTVNPTSANVGEAVQYTITLTNTGDWELTKNSISDTLMGSLTASFANTLSVGSSESHVFNYVVKAEDPNPLPNTVTAIYDGTGFDDNNTAEAQALVTIPSNEIPEFGLIPGAIALLTSGGTFLFLRKRNK